MYTQNFTKDPNAVLDYTIDWSKWLGSDTISASTWEVPAGLTQPASATNTSSAATVWVGGGTAGTVYTVTNRITTAGGRTEERSLYITASER